MNKDKLRQLGVVLSVAAVIGVNALANALPLNGLNTGEISDRFEVYFVPAGYVFSIWGLIYLLLIGYAVFQALPAQRENPRLREIGLLFILSCLANIVWLFLWHYEYFVLTVIAMLALLGLLIVIYLRLGTGVTAVSKQERWLVQLPFSVYLGWVSVATIANFTSVLDYLNWGGWGISPEVWAVIMLVVGVLLGIVMALSRRDAAYLLVLVWAYVGIAVKQADTALVATSAWIGAAVLFVLAILSLVAGKKK
jgi:hypothetical protein